MTRRMSIFLTVHATCGNCGAESDVQLAASVNADRRPDLRQAILDGTFQAVTCPGCGSAIRLPAHLSYLDIGRGQWILVDGAERIEDWSTAEDEALALFGDTYGAGAPPPARELGAGLRPRLVFGWPALREKLVCDELGLDDATLELLKIAIIRDVAGPPFGDDTELRLLSGTDEVLSFAWVVAASEAELATLEVPRRLYDGITADAAAWSALRDEFPGRAFVDLKRLVFA